MSTTKNIALLLWICLASAQNFSKTILVGKNQPVKSIKEALEICVNGDVIKVEGGFYSENNLAINKQISLIGIDYPTISGKKKEGIFLIRANNVSIEGFHFADAGVSFVKDNAAIRLDSVSGCVIKNNRFSNNFFGIYIGKSWDCIISENKIISNQKAQTYSGNGIHLWYCRNVQVEKNYVEGHRD
ncbi:MAG: right-handed parallel beta-helix repeat-containing protein, partial [Bacteroidota bacterium]